ncbi:hypothetical protein BGW39_008855 [Mortierella sp. 14UC]|nr:hypothetical protein BGW39_008855 [Mortierella sp. 14UC]
MAQKPTAVCCMAHAVADENTLYIQGGYSAEATGRREVNQFVSLDLTVASWSTSNPPWVWPENPGNAIILTGSYHSMTVEKGLESLFIWNPYQPNPWWTYNTVSHYWSNFTMALPVITKQHGVRNGVDMDSNIVYIPSGNNNGLEMIINTPGNPALTQSAMPSAVFFQSWVWSTQRKTFLQYGGRSLDGKTASPILNEFNAAKGWALVTTTGHSPGDVSGHCMVSGKYNVLSAYGGKKMIVFGGHGLDGVAKAGIYVFDTSTREWTVGKAADPAQARTNMACAVSGDSFIAWGGESGQAIKDVTPIVYDMKNNQWTTQFNRVIAATATSGTGPTAEPNSPTLPNPSSTPNTPPGSTINAAAIGGGVTGALGQVTAAANGGHDHGQDAIQQAPMSIQLSHLSNSNIATPSRNNGNININSDNDTPMGTRNPQTRGEEDHQQGGGRSGPRGPQLRTPSTSQDQGLSEGYSLYMNRNQYLDRTQELARMMDNIRAEQEELEKSRLEHEALMRNYQHDTQSHHRP